MSLIGYNMRALSSLVKVRHVTDFLSSSREAYFKHSVNYLHQSEQMLCYAAHCLRVFFCSWLSTCRWIRRNDKCPIVFPWVSGNIRICQSYVSLSNSLTFCILIATDDLGNWKETQAYVVMYINVLISNLFIPACSFPRVICFNETKLNSHSYWENFSEDIVKIFLYHRLASL